MKAAYTLKSSGEFVIENYNFAKPFSSFLPGVAGIYGKPLWCFYVNRGQGVCSFGVEHRENMIMEFIPADQAYQRTPSLSFRTFYKIHRTDAPECYEPFRNDPKIPQKMMITPADFSLIDEHPSLKTIVNIFTLPEENFPALMRQLTIQNTTNTPITFEIVDGLPRLTPFGMNEFFCKNMSRTSEAWMGVENLVEQGIPFFKLKVIPLDEAKVQTIDQGNFWCCFDQQNHILSPIVNPEVLFGPNLDFSIPYEFFYNENFIVPKTQATDNRTPCAFFHYQLTLAPGEQKTFYQMIGQMPNLRSLQNNSHRFKSNYFLSKQQRNKDIITEITAPIDTISDSKAFDCYTQQTYLDNVLRGGMPLTLAKEPKENKIFYVFSRKHGDLERDYNRFSIAPTFYSQGNGNYRDVNQNRRSDLFFNLDLQDQTIIQMLNLIQLDGYNPLIIKGRKYELSASDQKKYPFLQPTFSPGELYEALQNQSELKGKTQELFTAIMLKAKSIDEADHQEGFWSDHWAYNLDLIERYLSIFPDKITDFFINNTKYSFYDDTYQVLPRHQRYQKNADGKLRQTQFIEKNKAKEKLIQTRKQDQHIVRTKLGKGTCYFTNLTVKMLHLILIKACTLDPAGNGIEMEAGKPNWYDSINGLPALFGSSTAESFELIRWTRFLRERLAQLNAFSLNLPEEIYFLLDQLTPILSSPDFIYWEKSNSIKETFREKTLFGISGIERAISQDQLLQFLDQLLAHLSPILQKTIDPQTGVHYTYYKFDPIQFQCNENAITVSQFQTIPLPLFLEGPMHRMRLATNEQESFALFEKVKASNIFDRELKMYKVNGPLTHEPIEIGRNKIFTPGWLENESVWLHMEYKYLLELLRTGLNYEFEYTMRDVLIAFQDPMRYGRSILENSSFIASSANPDQTRHGQGFVARLSGSTAEFIHIWIDMCFGKKLFYMENGQLKLNFTPKIPGWLFLSEPKSISYSLTDGSSITETVPMGALLVKFLGKIPVIFINPNRKNTWDHPILKIRLYPLNGDPIEITGSIVQDAELIRSLKVNKIEIFL